VLRNVLGLTREELTRGRRILHNGEHHDLYSLQNIVRVMKMRKWAGYVAHTRYIGNIYKILGRKPER
jgi:hypothetical protein